MGDVSVHHVQCAFEVAVVRLQIAVSSKDRSCEVPTLSDPFALSEINLAFI